jgi:hypothetical protein
MIWLKAGRDVCERCRSSVEVAGCTITDDRDPDGKTYFLCPPHIGAWLLVFRIVHDETYVSKVRCFR